MAAPTKLANIINPEVMAPFVATKLIANVVFTPIASVDTTLQARAGNTITFPVWDYIGKAEDLAEGVAHTAVNMSATSKDVTVKKAVKTVSFTDEALLSGYGDLQGETEMQLATSFADKVNQDVFDQLKTLTPLAGVTIAPGVDWLADALVEFGEDVAEQTFLFISPHQLADFRKDPMFIQIMQGQAILTGHVGQLLGTEIVVSKLIEDGEAFIVRNGAMGIAIKRGLDFETDRDIWTKVSAISADMHYATYVKNASKAVYIKKP